MKRAAILLVLLSSASAFGQKFEVSDLSAADSPVSFSGAAKVAETGTTCLVTMHNNSSQNLLAIEVTGEVTDPLGRMQPAGFSYDGFFKERGISPGDDVDIVTPDYFPVSVRETTYINGVPVPVKPEEPKKDLVCHAEFKVQFFQLEDGSISGDYQIQKDVMARREKQIAVLSHFVEAYDMGGDAALAAALDEPESRRTAIHLKYSAEYFKVPLIDLVRKRLALVQKRQASGIF
jgi:hypothetical protein